MTATNNFQVQLKAVDIGNAIIEQEMALQASHTYLGAILKQGEGRFFVDKETFESLRATQWEVAISTKENGIEFEFLDEKALDNIKLGKTPQGLVVPS